MRIFVFILFSYLCCGYYSIHMQRDYKPASKESAFRPSGLSDSPLSAEASLFTNMETREIPSAPGYFVSENGNVYSSNYNKTGKYKELSIDHCRNGYARIMLSVDGIRKHYLVHRLVAETFIPNPQRLKQINHINSIRNDNRVINLEWSNQSKNILHGYKYGYCIPTRGERSGNHILTSKEVILIRKLWIPRKVSQYKLADMFGVKRGAIKDIVENKTWRHLL